MKCLTKHFQSIQWLKTSPPCANSKRAQQIQREGERRESYIEEEIFVIGEEIKTTSVMYAPVEDESCDGNPDHSNRRVNRKPNNRHRHHLRRRERAREGEGERKGGGLTIWVWGEKWGGIVDCLIKIQTVNRVSVTKVRWDSKEEPEMWVIRRRNWSRIQIR